MGVNFLYEYFPPFLTFNDGEESMEILVVYYFSEWVKPYSLVQMSSCAKLLEFWHYPERNAFGDKIFLLQPVFWNVNGVKARLFLSNSWPLKNTAAWEKKYPMKASCGEARHIRKYHWSKIKCQF